MKYFKEVKAAKAGILSLAFVLFLACLAVILLLADVAFAANILSGNRDAFTNSMSNVLTWLQILGLIGAAAFAIFTGLKIMKSENGIQGEDIIKLIVGTALIAGAVPLISTVAELTGLL